MENADLIKDETVSIEPVEVLYFLSTPIRWCQHVGLLLIHLSNDIPFKSLFITLCSMLTDVCTVSTQFVHYN